MNEFEGYVIAGRYKIEKKLAEGGMGRIFLAEEILSKRKVAIKKLHVLKRKSKLIERFHLEADVLKRIKHPNIVSLYDYLSWKGDFYMVLEYLEGQTLRERMNEGDSLSMSEITDIFTQLLDGLEAAHKESIVHRDLKPSNIFLVEKDDKMPFVKIVDFGIAIFLKSDMKSRLTRTGEIIGTPMYFSPEQIVGKKDITPQSDIYSLGIILFEMINGFMPYSGENDAELLLNSLYKPPAGFKRSDLKDNPLYQKFTDIVTGCLKKNLNDRFRSVSDIRDFLNSAPNPESSKRTDVEFNRRERQRRSFLRPSGSKSKSGFTTLLNSRESSAKETITLKALTKSIHISVLEDPDRSVEKSIIPLLIISDYFVSQIDSPFTGETDSLDSDTDLFILNGKKSENLEFFNKLKISPGFSSVPVMMCGEENDLDFIAAAINAGAVDYISFPFSPEDIILKISSVENRDK